MSGASERRSRSRRRQNGLGAVGALAARRPRFVIAVWVLPMLVLGVLGFNLGSKLQAHPLYVDGTGSQRAHEITLRKFGSDENMVVALRGPHAAVERQGRKLVAAIEALPEALVISPWSAGRPIAGLSPTPQVVGIVVRVGHRPNEALEDMLEVVEGQIDKTVADPVKANITGLPKVFKAYSEASDSTAKNSELIAIPILLIVLLLVFRSVLAALIPIVIGAAVVAGSEGVMRLLLGSFVIDAFALGAVGMMGLALGVDYSLLVVSRFREERHRGNLQEAVQATVEATGRSILPAGFGLLLAMLIASQILPGAAVGSAALAIMIATVLSMFSALWVAPAVLMLLAGSLDRWSLPERVGLRGTPLRLTSRITRSPVAVGAVILAVFALAGLASILHSTVATPELLPAGSPGRVEGEEIERSLGPGWLAPIEVVVSGGGKPMTSPEQVRSLAAFQGRVEGDSGVQTVAGFESIQRSLEPLEGFEEQLVKQNDSVSKLSGGLARMEGGAAEGGDGLREAASGAGRVGNGVESASAGAALLAEGLGTAHTGSSRLSRGLSRVSVGSGRLAHSSSSVSSGAARLAQALSGSQKQVAEMRGTVRATKSAMRLGEKRLADAEDPLESAEDRLTAARQAMERMTTGASDPEYAPAEKALKEASELLSGSELESDQPDESGSGVSAGIARAQRQFDLGLYLAGKMGKSNGKASTNAGRLADASRKLDRGIERLADGTQQLSEGVARLSTEGGKLSPALRRLSQGTESLQSGLGRLGVKAGDLAGGLSAGAQGQESLADALHRMASGLSAQSDGGSQLDRLRRRSPGLFDSGYFYLAGLDGADKKQRDQADLMIDLDHGGHTGRMMVVPRDSITTAQGRDTLDRVRDDAQALAGKTGMEVVVGGLTASQVDIDHALRERTLLARVVLMLISLIVLVPVMRSLIVPIIAMFVNLLTVSASLGFLALMFNNSLLGGPGYVDSIVMPAMVMVIFGLAIDYEVFIFARMREEYLRTGSPEVAIQNGLLQTAPVVTGAAIVMIAVFLSFAVSSFVTVRDFGVAQAAAVFIDAFIVRLIIVPTVMRALGRWGWWMPRWLDRLIPGGEAPSGWEAGERITPS